MARRKSKSLLSKKQKAVLSLVLLALLIIAVAAMYFMGVLDDILNMLSGEAAPDEPSTDEPSTDEPSTDEPSTDEPSTDEPSTDEPSTDEPSREPVSVEGEMEIHVIDCGQADCILLLSEDEVMLVDTGDLDDDYTNKIINYLKDFNITSIDYLILTHADSDHIGGAPEIINEFDIGKCIMPDFVKTTKIYENTLKALSDNQVDCELPTPGDIFTVGEASCKILAPLKDYKDCNDSSVVIRVDFGKRSVLLTGDAEKESEADIASTYSSADLKVDVLKSGHHGSRTSSSTGLLDKADPEYAVISCGEGNSYGHPHEETIERYESYGITTYRTDLLGTIVLTTDGTSLEFEFEKAS